MRAVGALLLLIGLSFILVHFSALAEADVRSENEAINFGEGGVPLLLLLHFNIHLHLHHGILFTMFTLSTLFALLIVYTALKKCVFVLREGSNKNISGVLVS